MSFFSFSFIALIFLSMCAYYIVPKNFQWIVLLIVNVVFYASFGWKSFIYIVFTSLSIYLATLLMEKVSQKYLIKIKGLDKSERELRKKLRNEEEKIRKYILIGVLIANIGILGYTKYISSIFSWVGELGNRDIAIHSIFVPVGISFYTFTAVGYLLDVYMERTEVERNFFRLFLFISFFPSIIQGPINRYKEHGQQLLIGHDFDLQKIEQALVLILWGMFKKLVIADRTIVAVQTVLDNPDSYVGWQLVVGLLIYSAWQYTDFSGGIDIVTGVAELFDIKIALNFKRPYFSMSLSEFWRRWHISLGAWMKDYVFYPIALSDGAKKLKNSLSKVIKPERSSLIVMGLGNIVVFLLVGLWHGPYWHYVLWGLYNGMIIALSTVLEPDYSLWKKALHINDEARWYKYFKILRTFVIINIGWIFDYCDGFKKIASMFRNIFIRFSITTISIDELLNFGMTNVDWVILLIALLILFIVSMIEEKGIEIREVLFKAPLVLRWIALYALIFFVAACSVISGAATFLYAQF